MTALEQNGGFKVSITKSEDDPPAVDLQVNWDNGKTDSLKRITYQENRRYPSIQDLFSQVTREKFLRDLQTVGGGTLALVSVCSAFVIIDIAKKFGGYDMTTVLSEVIDLGFTAGGIALGIDGAEKAKKPLAILSEAQRVISYSIASILPQLQKFHL